MLDDVFIKLCLAEYHLRMLSFILQNLELYVEETNLPVLIKAVLARDGLVTMLMTVKMEVMNGTAVRLF